MFLAENAVVGKMLFDQRSDRGFRRLVALGNRIEAARKLVRDIEAGAEARQRFRLGGFGQAIEERAIRKHEISVCAGGMWRFS